MRKFKLDQCNTDLEKAAVTALIEIEELSSVIVSKSMQQAIWRTLIHPFDVMEDRGIITRKKQTTNSDA